MKRKPYRTCPECGAHLDHGETCDCVRSPEPFFIAREPLPEKAGQGRIPLCS